MHLSMFADEKSEKRVVDWKSHPSSVQYHPANATVTVPQNGIYLVRRPVLLSSV